MRCQCVLFVSSTSCVVFNPSAGAITDHSQLAKDIEPYLKSQLYEVSQPRKASTHFTEWAE